MLKRTTFLLAVILVAAWGPSSNLADDPAPVPAVSGLTVDSTPYTAAQVGGKWLRSDSTRQVVATFTVDGSGWVEAYRMALTEDRSTGKEIWLPGPEVELIDVETAAGTSLGLSGPAGRYFIRLTRIVDGRPRVTTTQVVVGPQPTPDDPTPGPQPTPSSWASVLAPAASAVKLTPDEAKVMADAFRAKAAGSYETVRALTEAASKQYTDQLGINRIAELLTFRQAIVAELTRLQLNTVAQYQAEFLKLAEALEALK